MTGTIIVILVGLVGGLVGVVIIFGPRPKLDGSPREHRIPDLPVDQLDTWLKDQESKVSNLVEGAGAHIQWADPSTKQRTPLAFLYLHGFSATWPETAPVTQNIAQHFSSNVVQARIAGHGEGPDGMLTAAEDWLQSVADQFELTQRIGERVVIIATSTGAPLATWLAAQPRHATDIHACVFMSPNFRIRNPFGFLLTWPWSKHWIQTILGKEYKGEPVSDEETNCWTQQYSTLALIEMQKTVDWAKIQSYENIKVPVMMMYMKNDGTVHPPTAVRVFDRWGSPSKELISVPIDEDAREHVFVGDITAPHRVDWCVSTLITFLEGIEHRK